MKTTTVFTFLFLVPCLALCQVRADSLEQKLEQSYGLERLETLHQLIRFHMWADSRKATRFAKQAQILSEDIFNEDNSLIPPGKFYLSAETLVLAGKAHYARGQYLDAQHVFQAAMEKAQEVGYDGGETEAKEYLEKIDSIARIEDISEGFIKSAFKNLNLSEKTSSSSNDFNISANLKLARHYEKNGNYAKAIRHNEQAINHLRNKGDAQQINQLHAKIAQLYQKAGLYEESLAFYEMAIRDSQKIADSATIDSARLNMGTLLARINTNNKLATADTITTEYKGQPTTSTRVNEPNLVQNLNDVTVPGQLAETEFDIVPDDETEDLRKLAQEFEQRQEYQKSLEYYKLYNELTTRVQEEERQQELALLENLFQIDQREIQITNLKQQKEIQELELEEQKKFRNNLIVGAVLLLSLAMALYFMYSGKRKDHKKLQTAYGISEATQSKLVNAEKRIKTLLTQQVSGAIANELLSGGSGEKKIEEKFVCIMFLDIRGFTPFAEQRSPEEIIKYQNDVFGFMIEIIHRHHGIINQFLGDGFMATFGAPVSTGDDCENAFQAATEIVEAVKLKSNVGDIPSTRVGIGLHAGNVVAGNVGTDERKQYSITGNTVIVASRIEQLTKEFDSNLLISEEVHKQLKSTNRLGNDFQEVLVKGRKKPVRIIKVA